MSIQPIITAAFSSFPVTRGLSVSGVENRFARSENSADSASTNTEATQSETAKTAETEKSSTSSQTSSSQISSTTNRTESTRDAGKPRSASGDILDISTPKKSADKDKSAEKTDAPANKESTSKDSAAQKLSSNGRELTAEQKSQVDKLKARDAEVKAHEAAHLAAAGQYAKGGASYSYQTGPDGVKYAIGGEVAIDSSPVKGDPDATIAKAQQIRTAAMAPANPSGQDYKVAAAASEMAARAAMEKSRTMSESQQSSSSSETASTESQVVAASDTAADETASTESVSTKSEVVNNSFVTSYNNFSAATANTPTLSANGGAAENPVKPVTLPSNVAPDRGARQSIKSSNDLAQLAENIASANKANAESLNGLAAQQATNSVAASYLSQSRLTSRFSAFA